MLLAPVSSAAVTAVGLVLDVVAVVVVVVVVGLSLTDKDDDRPLGLLSNPPLGDTGLPELAPIL